MNKEQKNELMCILIVCAFMFGLFFVNFEFTGMAGGEFGIFALPTHSNPILNSTFRTNYTTENLTCWNQSTADTDGNYVRNIYNWYKNSQPIMALNMPFEGGSNQTFSRDYSGSENNGTGANLIWGSDYGYDGRGAYKWNGTGGYLEITGLDDSFVANPTGHNLSLSFWMKPNDCKWSSYIIASGAQSNYAGIYCLLDVDENISCKLCTTEETWSTSIISGINIDKWYHVGVAFNDKQDIFKLYINGQLNNTGTKLVEEHSHSETKVFIGKPLLGSHFFNGTLDEFRIYNISLSAEQVLALYENRTNMIASNETLVGEIWNCSVTPNDGTDDGITKYSNNLTINDTDSTAPTIENVWPSNNSNWSWLSHQVNLTYNVTDAGGSIVNCTLYIDNEVNWSNISITEEANQTFNLTFADGSYLWNVQCEDDIGNLGNSTIDNFTLDTTAPTINLQFPKNNTYQNNLNQINFTFNVTDNISVIDTCSIFINQILNTSDSGITELINQTFNLTFDSYRNFNWTIQCNDTLNNIANSTTYNYSLIEVVEAGEESEDGGQAPSTTPPSPPAPPPEEEPAEEEPGEEPEEEEPREEISIEDEVEELMDEIDIGCPEIEDLARNLVKSLIKEGIKPKYIKVDFDGNKLIIDAGGEGDLIISFDDGKPRFDFNLFGGKGMHLEEPKKYDFLFYLIGFVVGFFITGVLLRNKIRKVYKYIIDIRFTKWEE